MDSQARHFETSGLQRQTAEQLAEYITELIITNKARMEESFVNKNVLDKVRGRWAAAARLRHIFPYSRGHRTI